MWPTHVRVRVLLPLRAVLLIALTIGSNAINNDEPRIERVRRLMRSAHQDIPVDTSEKETSGNINGMRPQHEDILIATILDALIKYEDEQVAKGMQSLNLSATNDPVRGKPFLYLQPPHTGTVTAVMSLTSVTGTNVAHDHRTLQKRVTDWGAFDQMVSFTFVRSPWERVLSCAGWTGNIDGIHVNKGLTKEEEIPIFRQFAKALPKQNPCGYLQNQVDFVYAKRPGEEKARQQLTFVGRTDNLQNDFNKVCDLLGVKHIDLSSVFNHCVSSCPKQEGWWEHMPNKEEQDASPKPEHWFRRDYKEYYDQEAADVVAEIFKDEIEKFGFKFGQ